MKYLLDTCVVSELMRKKSNVKVVRWVNDIPIASQHISVLTLGEIRKGMQLVQDTTRREKLIAAFEQDIIPWFGDRILTIDNEVADRWGYFVAEAGRPLPIIDSLLAATAFRYNLRMVTRNTKDFDHVSLDVVNPWDL